MTGVEAFVDLHRRTYAWFGTGPANAQLFGHLVFYVEGKGTFLPTGNESPWESWSGLPGLSWSRITGIMLLSTAGGSNGRRGYPPVFRRRAIDLLDAGRKVVDLARDLGISNQTIYAWRRQEAIDRGLVAGLTRRA
jgi:hypothetical protein